MMMKKLFPLALLLGLFWMGCTRPADRSAAGTEQLSNTWVLERLQNQTLDAGQPGRRLPELVINESEKLVTGYTGCNRLSGTITVAGNHITFNRLVTTKMACAGESLEQPFLGILNDSSLSFQLAPGTLTLLQDGKPVLVFKKAG